MTALWYNLLNGPLYTNPEQWEVTKKMVAMDCIPAIHLLRNIKRLNEEAKDHKALGRAIANVMGAERVPPYLWYLAEKGVPHYREELHQAMIRAKHRQMPGDTVVLLDVSKEMLLPAAPGLADMEEAAAWAVTMRPKRIFTVSNHLQEVKDAVGIGGVDKILMSQAIGSCHTAAGATDLLRLVKFDRLVVFTKRTLTGRTGGPYLHYVSKPGFGLYRLDETERNFSMLDSLSASKHSIN